MEQGNTPRRGGTDVLVLGGGMAGWATAKLLAERGWMVEVIDDPDVEPSGLGESLEFSAPLLLAELGVEPAALLAADDGWAKNNVFVEQMAAATFEIWPPGWFRHPPLFGSHFTLHVDRLAVDERLRQGALRAGARLRADRVIGVEREGVGANGMIGGVTLRSGLVQQARWYVDASGHRSRLLGRALDLDMRLLGDERVALHQRLAVAPQCEVTRLLFGANGDERMTWGWVLPIGTSQVSVGVVVPAHHLRATRAGGRSSDEVFYAFVDAFEGVAEHLGGATAAGPLRSRAYAPYTHTRTVGPNWILIGDAAALLDPITSSGVATGLHSAFTAHRLIDRALQHRPEQGGPADRRLLVAHERAHHHLTVRTTTVVNQLVDRVVHRRGLRALIGTRLAIFVYAITNVLINAWYNRFRPSDRRRIVVHGLLLGAARSLSRMALGLDLARRPLRALRRRRRSWSHPSGPPPRLAQAFARPTPSRSG